MLYNNTITAVRARLWLTSVRPKERTEKRQAHRVEHGSLRDKSTEGLPNMCNYFLTLLAIITKWEMDIQGVARSQAARPRSCPMSSR